MPASRKGHRMANPPGRERHLRWLQMRKQGLTYQEIADREGVIRQAVHGAIKRLISNHTRDSVDELVALEAERLDHLQRKVWKQATRTGDEEQLPALDRVLRIMERRASLYGLDGREPTSGDESRDVPIDELRELLDGLGYRLVRKDGEEDESGGSGDG